MSTTNFDKFAIVRPLNYFTGRLEGDDSGYRKVPVSPFDESNPDPMETLTTVATRPLYAVGATEGLCTYYPGGLGGPDQVLVRAPIARGLEEADRILATYERKLIVVDGWRPYLTQAALWRYLRREIVVAEGLQDSTLTIFDEVRIGMKADDVGSYCAAVENEEFGDAKTALIRGMQGSAVESAATKLRKSVDETATLYLTFMANLGMSALKLQEDAVTAHGNGGAVDLWMTDRSTGKYANLGVPFDYVPPPETDVSPAVINYFEMVELKHYQNMVARDPTLQKYLAYFGVRGIGDVTQRVFDEAQRERRVLFHTMMTLGGSYFSLDKDLGEPWHFQLGNERGGRQANETGLCGSGNGCHAILKGKAEAVWSNAVGHRLAAEILRK